MRKLLALVSLVLIVVGLLAAIRLLVRQEDARSLDLPGPVRAVEVDVDTGSIEVVGGGAGDGARVRYHAHWGWLRPDRSESVEDGVLRVRARCRFSFLVGCGVDYRVEVPSGVTVQGRSQAGSVRVSGVSGAVDAESDAGAIRLEAVSGEVTARSDAGNVTGSDVGSTVVDAQTDAGSVRLSFTVTPDRVVARSDAGTIDLTVPDAPYQVQADTEAGDVDVEVVQDPGAPRSITAETDAGNIRIHRGGAR